MENIQSLETVALVECHDAMNVYERAVKRLIDIVVSLFGIIILSPAFVLVYLAILVTGGSVIYKQERIGYKGKKFFIYKFRTMYKDAEKYGIPRTEDERLAQMTRVGRFLRDHHLDELPQMFNVLNGDMSLVGPRPEVRHYVDYWTPEQMRVLDVRPGITDPASIKFRNENELMERAENPEKYYIEVIMQEKIRLYLEYVEHHSFLGDIGLIFKTFWTIVRE